MIRILVADDQALFRAGLQVLLEATDDVELVGEAADGRTAVELAQRELPDVVLMDVRMPGMDGIEATRPTCCGRSGWWPAARLCCPRARPGG